MYSHSLLLPGSPQNQEPSPTAYAGQSLFPDYGDETLSEEDEDENQSMAALETELQKYLFEDWRLNLKQQKSYQSVWHFVIWRS